MSLASGERLEGESGLLDRSRRPQRVVGRHLRREETGVGGAGSASAWGGRKIEPVVGGGPRRARRWSSWSDPRVASAQRVPCGASAEACQRRAGNYKVAVQLPKRGDGERDASAAVMTIAFARIGGGVISAGNGSGSCTLRLQAPSNFFGDAVRPNFASVSTRHAIDGMVPMRVGCRVPWDALATRTWQVGAFSSHVEARLLQETVGSTMVRARRADLTRGVRW